MVVCLRRLYRTLVDILRSESHISINWILHVNRESRHSEKYGLVLITGLRFRDNYITSPVRQRSSCPCCCNAHIDPPPGNPLCLFS